MGTRFNEIKLVHSPEQIEIDPNDVVIFLAGPIQGAEDWQTLAWECLKSEATKLQATGGSNPNLIVANPRSPTRHGDYNAQVDWETAHLNRAGARGLILFWLAKQKTHFCERPHGQTTRFELGEWLGKKQYRRNIRIKIGIEEGFTNDRYIKRRATHLWPGENMIHETLEKACASAIDGLSFLVWTNDL